MSEDRAAPVPRGAKTTLKPQPAREFICVVGGPCNTFNGWISVGFKGSEAVWITGAPPHTRAEVKYYLAFAPHKIDVAALPKSEWGKHGWWEESVKALQEKGWKGSDLEVTLPTSSHDIYWGNFVNPAARLYKSTPAWDAPLQRPDVRPGDIVTFLVYVPPYEMRGRVDFNASPYNIEHRTKPDAKKYWEGGAIGPPLVVPETPPAPPSKPGYISPQALKKIQERQEKDDAAKKADADKTLSEEDINFHILMRTTDENTDEYIKRPKYADHYMKYLFDELLSGVEQPKAMTKILLVREPQEIVDYISKGTWKGKPVDAYDSMKNWDNPSEEDLKDETPKEEKNYAFTPPKPVKTDTRGRPLKWTLPWYKHWDGFPSVDRKKVLVHRFDYIGHSTVWVMMLSYGWDNKKGYMIKGDVTKALLKEQLDACFSGKVLTPDAHAMLWGCNLGATSPMPDGTKSGIGPYIAKHFGGGVVAAEAKTSFTAITHKPTNMPTPDNGHWTLYPKPKK